MSPAEKKEGKSEDIFSGYKLTQSDTGSIFSGPVLFWIMHPTTWLRALSKRDTLLYLNRNETETFWLSD